MLFLWSSLNTSHIGVIRISKWCLLFLESETPLSPLCFDRGNWPRMLLLTLFLKYVLNFLRFWYIESYVWTDEHEQERTLTDAKGNWRRAHDRWGEVILVYHFDTVVGVREPNYGDVCLSLLHVGFQEKQFFWLMGCDMSIIDKCIIIFIRLVLSEDLRSVNFKLELYMHVYVKCDLLMILLLMILINIRWHWCLW